MLVKSTDFALYLVVRTFTFFTGSIVIICRCVNFDRTRILMRRFTQLLAGLLLLNLLSLSANGNPMPGRDEGNPYLSYETDYRWLEIEDIGEQIVELEDNTFVGPIAIGFDFPYFGRLYDNVYVSSNGMIGFGPTDEYGRSANQELPNHNSPDNIVAIYWKNLAPRTDWGEGSVYFGHREGNFVVQYQDYPEVNENGHSPQNTITMQIVLKPDGDVVLQFKTIGDDFNVGIGTVGLENFDGSEGLTIRYDGEGSAIESGSAYLISDHGPGSFLVWNGGASTPSGAAQVVALNAEDHSVTFLQSRLNQQLPDDLSEFEAVFVNLGNYGQNGRNYHRLTGAEGEILAGYARSGGNIYLEGSDFWTGDPVTDAHPLFRIEGIIDGHSASGPIAGVDGSFTEGLVFDEYSAQDNDYMDHLGVMEDAQEVLTFRDADETAVGMVAFSGEVYRTVGSSIEFGGLVDGEGATKQELIRRIVNYFREPTPEFGRPINLRAVAGDGEVVLAWDMPNRNEQLLGRRLELQHQIAAFTSHNQQKPTEEILNEIYRLRQELIRLEYQEMPARDDLLGFKVYVNNEEFDFTNSHRYTAIELANGTQYEFAISAIYRDPDGESELSDPVFVTPTGLWRVPVTLGFEQNNGALTANPGQNGWTWGAPAGGAANGQRAWATSLNGNYPNLADFELLTPRVVVPEGAHTFLTFNHKFNCEGGWDGGRVEFSPDNGDRWETLVPTTGYPERSIFVFDGGAGFSGNSGGWVASSFDLTALAGQTVTLKFRFKSDDSNVGPGWLIDDLRLFAPETGSLTASVRTSADQLPISAALVVLNGVYRANSDINGVVRFVDIPSGNYAYVVTALGFEELRGNFGIEPNPNNQRAFFMDEYDSRITVEPEFLERELEAGEQLNVALTVRNAGNRPTSFQAYIDYFVQGGGDLIDNPEIGFAPVPERDEPWELLETYNLTEKTGDQYHIAAEFIRGGTPRSYNLVTTAGDFGSDTSHLYVMNRAGDVVNRLQLGNLNNNNMDGWGTRDLAYDGTFLYGSSTTAGELVRINPAAGGVLGREILTPLGVARAVAWIHEENSFWIGDRDDTWYKYRRIRVGESVLADRVTDHGLTGVVGMAWNPSDPDGACLYIHNQESDNGGAAIYRFNPRTRELIREIETATEEEGFAGGAFTTYLYDTQTWMLGVVIQGPDADVLKLYELWPKQNWVKTSPLVVQLAGGAETQLQVSFDARGRVDSELSANIELYDFMGGRVTNVPVTLLISGGSCSLEGVVSLDGEGALENVALTLNGVEANPDNEGNYGFFDLIPGLFQLTATLDGYDAFISDSFSISPNENLRRNFELAHIHRGILSGHINSAHNENGWLEGVDVAAINEDDNSVYGVGTTDAEGYYEITLPEGTYGVTPRLSAWHADRVNNIEIQDGGITELNFTMDDRLPMGSIRVNGNFDDRVAVIWDPPGTIGRTDSLRYDNGPINNAVFLRGRDDVIAVRFEPEDLYDITAVQIYMFRRGDFGFNGWQGWAAVPIQFKMWEEDPETGLPGEEIWSDYDQFRVATQWVTVRPADIRFRRGAFYVGWHQDMVRQVATFQATGLDGHLDHPDVTHLRIDGQWHRFNGLPGDNMIRAVVYSYREDAEERLAPRPLREVGDIGFNNEALSDRIEIARGPSIDSQLLASDASPPVEFVENEDPGRDPPNGYKILVDGQIVAEGDFPNYRYNFIEDTNGEDEEHTFQVVAVYDENIEMESDEIVGKYNMAPGVPTNIIVTNNGPNYTIRWNAPARNADNVQNCTDYAGCRVIINGQEVGRVNAPTLTFTAEMPEGDEGWYDLSLIAYDEVPNYSVPVTARVPLGLSQYFSFDGGAPPAVFTAAPFGKWARTSSLVNGPGSAHSGTFVWGTNQPSPRHYENNANWTLTTISEYLITSQNARVEFFHYLSAEAGRDGGQFLVSVDGGAYQLLTPIGGYPDQTVAAFQNRPAFTGEIPAWQIVSFDLSDYQGQALRFRWLFKTDNAIDWYSGWFLDDFVVWGGAPPVAAQIFGVARDQNGQVLAGVKVSNGRVSTQTNQQGNYNLIGLVPGFTNLSATLAGYQADVIETVLRARDNIRVDFELYRPLVTFSDQGLEVALGGNDRLTVNTTLRNESEISIPYVLRLMNQVPNRDSGTRSLRGTTETDPLRDQQGDINFDHDLTAITGLQRIMGAEYAADQIFVTSGDPIRGLSIAVLNRDGVLVRQFAQPQANRVGWGLRDLAWDGTYLYGSQNDSIYAITVDGQLHRVQPGAPLTVNRALAYSSEPDAFWCGEYDLPWYLVDRDGDVLQEWDGHGLTGVYGFGWNPGDPDDLPLYVANLEPDGGTKIYRSNPERGVIEETELQFVGPPTGLFVTGSWDANRWIMGVVVGRDSQHLLGVELNPRVSWITINPIEGELASESTQELTIDFEVPPGAEENDVYEADIMVRSFDGTVASLHVSLEIVSGFRHFDNPEVTENRSNIHVLSIDFYGSDLMVGSEIAAITPGGQVGGVVRWVEAPAEFIAYGGDNGFSQGDSMALVIWDSGSNEEYHPEVEYVTGDFHFRDNDEVEVRLVVRDPDRHVIRLARGWNLISSYVVPFELEVPIMFSEIRDREHLVIVKDGLGRFWTTRFDYNGLGPWNPLHGYQVNVNEDDSLVVTGRKIEFDTPIPLSLGWNTVGYLLDHPIDPRIGLEGIMQSLLLAKNGVGDFIAPRFGYFGIESLIPGEGYKIKVDRRTELVYQDEENRQQIAPLSIVPNLQSARSTGSDMSLLVTDAPASFLGNDVSLVAVSKRSGQTVGRGSLSSLPAGLIVRGDDTLTFEIDGAVDDELLAILAVKVNNVIAQFESDERVLKFSTDGFEAISLKATQVEIPSVLTLTPTYPNPFNSRTTIRFGLPILGKASTRLIDLQGRVVWSMSETQLEAGWHTYTIDAVTLPTGIYWLEIIVGQSMATEKLVLLR